MPERFLVRLEDGPGKGNYWTTSDEQRWPLPEVLSEAEDGYYMKVSESALDPQPEDSGLVRGAAYRWVERVEGDE